MLTWRGPPWARCCVWNARSIISSPSGPVLNASMVLLTNGASRLERKFSKRTLAFIIWEKAVEQSGDNVEHGSQISAMRPEMLGDPMKEFLGMTHPGQHRKTRFDNHALIPSAFGTQFEVGWEAIFIPETQIGQGNTLIDIILEEKVEVLVRPVQGQPVPLDHAPGLIQQPPQPDANAPAPFILAFASNLTFATAFPDGKEQSDRIAMSTGKERG